MSIADRKSFLKECETALESILTVNLTGNAMQLIAEKLEGYDVEAIPNGNAGMGLDLLEIFIDAKRIEGRSEKTLERYNYIIKRAFEYIKVPVQNVTVYHLRSYLALLKLRGNADSTIGGVREVMCSFFGWLSKEGLIETNPCANLSSIKCAKKIRLAFSATEIERIKESCKTNRDRAIVCFLLSTGCRISEVCALDRQDIDLHHMEVVVKGKGNKERTVYIDSVTAMMLKRYFSKRDDADSALFIGQRGRMTARGVRTFLKGIERISGVENIHPHRFRRTLATNLINHGMQIQEVAAILGHEKIDTTMRYVCLNKTNVKHNYQKYA